VRLPPSTNPVFINTTRSLMIASAFRGRCLFASRMVSALGMEVLAPPPGLKVDRPQALIRVIADLLGFPHVQLLCVLRETMETPPATGPA